MNTIIMLFSLPIGIYLLIQEKRAMRKYQAIFDDFFRKLKADPELPDEERLQLAEEMLYRNRYNIVERDKRHIVAEKKLFSVGWLFVGLGTFYIGLIIYILYYLYFQKPHRVLFDLGQ